MDVKSGRECPGKEDRLQVRRAATPTGRANRGPSRDRGRMLGLSGRWTGTTNPPVTPRSAGPTDNPPHPTANDREGSEETFYPSHHAVSQFDGLPVVLFRDRPRGSRIPTSHRIPGESRGVEDFRRYICSRLLNQCEQGRQIVDERMMCATRQQEPLDRFLGSLFWRRSRGLPVTRLPPTVSRAPSCCERDSSTPVDRHVGTAHRVSYTTRPFRMASRITIP